MKSTFLREDRVLSREVTLQVRTSDKYKKENKYADDEWERAAAENRCVRWGESLGIWCRPRLHYLCELRHQPDIAVLNKNDCRRKPSESTGEQSNEGS